MKLQVDTENKTITIEESINLGELYRTLFKMFPELSWESYNIVPVKTIEHWTSPITLPGTRPWNEIPWVNPLPLYPLVSPGTVPGFPGQPYTITCGNGDLNKISGHSSNTNSSVYNVIINNDELAKD